MATIEFDAVTKRYKDGTEAVRQLDLDIQDGEFMILVGPSGCGKSTALRMIAGLEDVSEGELKIGGDVVNDLAPRDRDIAMVFQNYALYPHMSVRDNMGFALKLAKVDKSEINRKVTEAAEMLDLTEQLDRKPANLSGGQRQRVAMGRAIVREPKAFLMDEPLSNLDAKLRVQTRAQIARLQERLGTTTVYVTHDQTEAMTLGDRVCVLRKGIVQQVGTPRDLYQDPANLFVAGFIGSPGMNFMPARIEGETVKLPFGEVRLDDKAHQALDRHRSNGAAGGRNVIVGMRPEHFTDAREPIVHGGREGLEFSAVVDVVESLGSENFAYFHAKQHDGVPESAAVESLGEHAATADMPSTVADGQVIARLGPGTEVSHGDTIELRLDTSELRFFEPESGESLTR